VPYSGVVMGGTTAQQIQLDRAIDRGNVTLRNRAVHRAFDVVGATLLLLMTAPALLVVMLSVVCTSRGGALFRQTRVGRQGVMFTVLKFRTMHVDGDSLRHELRSLDEGNGVLFKIRRDPRVTPVGRVLRRLSLDELPQLINVLRGEMSLVGPRPALPDEVARYDAVERRRLLTKPGMTGLWQVSGRSDLSWAQSVELDLHYVRHADLWLDLRILLLTVRAVLTGRGAY
jgi:lipopolysaccharide/colanic/teichoic acid biosynthesis glycosyltransferase